MTGESQLKTSHTLHIHIRTAGVRVLSHLGYEVKLDVLPIQFFADLFISWPFWGGEASAPHGGCIDECLVCRCKSR